jgi:hypothetical protein
MATFGTSFRVAQAVAIGGAAWLSGTFLCLRPIALDFQLLSFCGQED